MLAENAATGFGGLITVIVFTNVSAPPQLVAISVMFTFPGRKYGHIAEAQVPVHSNPSVRSPFKSHWNDGGSAGLMVVVFTHDTI